MLTPADLQRLTMSINSCRVPDLRGCNTCYYYEIFCLRKGKIGVLEQICLLPAFHFIWHRLVSRPPGGALDVLVWWGHLKWLSWSLLKYILGTMIVNCPTDSRLVLLNLIFVFVSLVGSGNPPWLCPKCLSSPSGHEMVSESIFFWQNMYSWYIQW